MKYFGYHLLKHLVYFIVYNDNIYKYFLLMYFDLVKFIGTYFYLLCTYVCINEVKQFMSESFIRSNCSAVFLDNQGMKHIGKINTFFQF